MTRPTLHLPGVPHTVTHPRFSHCAFTEKVRKFAPMMVAEGWPVIHYGVAGAQSGATEDVDLMTEAEQEELLGRKHGDDPTRFVGSDADVTTPLYRQFNYDLRRELEARVKPGDIICLPFGRAHQEALNDFPLLAADRDQRAWAVETGIGYPETFVPYRIYESEAWRHYHLGHPRRGGQGSNWEWVIPNYFVADEWPMGFGDGDGSGPYVLYFGRLNDQKGLLVVCELARRRPDLRFVICGQGDPSYYVAQSPNIEYLPPKQGRDRAKLLGGALCVLMPSLYVEPFGGVTVEAQLCGTPVLGAVYGSFTETIDHGFNGFRCRTLGDWLAAIELVEKWDRLTPPMDRLILMDRPAIRECAVGRYSLEAVGPLYTAAFETILTLAGDGYKAHVSHLGPITKAIVPPPLEETGRDGIGRPPGTAVSENEWKSAQRFEKAWWLGNPKQWANEKKKQEFYAERLDFPKMQDADQLAAGMLFDFKDAHVLDVGCGPFSLMLRSRLGAGTGVDPIDYGPDLEQAYQTRGLQRIIGPAEKLAYDGPPFDEGWCYNCLQHVIDPAVILGHLAKHCRRVRLFEWLNIPAHEGHPHELRTDLFERAFPRETWEIERWEEGDSVTPLLYGRYLALVVTRRT